MSDSSTTEGRGCRRRPARFLVDYATEHGVRCDYATNLSPGGLFLETDDPLPEGTVVKLRFRLRGSDTLHEIEGRVAWQRGAGKDPASPPGMGIQFSDHDAARALSGELDDRR